MIPSPSFVWSVSADLSAAARWTAAVCDEVAACRELSVAQASKLTMLCSRQPREGDGQGFAVAIMTA
jgi:hypothetical protein